MFFYFEICAILNSKHVRKIGHFSKVGRKLILLYHFGGWVTQNPRDISPNVSLGLANDYRCLSIIATGLSCLLKTLGKD